MNNVAAESFSNIYTVKSLQTEKSEIWKYKEGNILVYKAGMRKALYKGLFAFS